MSKYYYLFIKLCKKFKINKFICKLTNFFVSEDKIEKNVDNARKDLCEYYPYRNASVVNKNKFHKVKYDLQIIVPVYNVEQYVEKCLDSILSQKTKYTYCVYIINDGSTDNSSNIINKYGDIENVRIINQENGGLAAARNTGLKDIYAKYIMFVDSDDYISSNCVDVMLKCAYENDADIVETSYVSLKGDRKIEYIKNTGCIEEKDLFGFAWGKVYKSDLFKELIFPNSYLYEDTMLYFMVFEKSKKIYSLSDITYVHTVNSGGIAMSSIGNKKSIDTYWITEILHNERTTLRYINDDKYVNKLKKQFIQNYSRTSLLPLNIQKDIFILEQDILKKTFDIQQLNDVFLEYIYNGQFDKYSHYAKWY